MTRPVALVTGANRGIGLEVARQLAARGYKVMMAARDGATLALVAPGVPHSVPVVLDVCDVASIRAAAAAVGEAQGRLDVLVNSAAIHYDTWEHAHDADFGIVEEAWQTNTLGAWRTTQAFLPLLRRSPRPRIVNVSSEAGSLAGMTGGTPAYSVSKAALNALTRLLAGELRREGFLVNAVCPGWTATDMGGGGRPVADGAASVVWAATLADDGPTGGFFRDGQPLAW